MKLNLSCCVNNKKSASNNLECDLCECVFERKELLDDHSRQKHEGKHFEGKQRMTCCDRNKTKEMASHLYACYYCECMFPMKDGLKSHTNVVHHCKKCDQVILTKESRSQHVIKHQKEKQQETKPKLPCCEINQLFGDSNKNLECDHCKCAFEKQELLDVHNREIHGFTGKRKMKCCERNVKKTKTSHEWSWSWSCPYCDCVFRVLREKKDHILKVHKCKICKQVTLSDDIRAQHKIQHEEEKRKQEEKRAQRKIQLEEEGEGTNQ